MRQSFLRHLQYQKYTVGIMGMDERSLGHMRGFEVVLPRGVRSRFLVGRLVAILISLQNTRKKDVNFVIQNCACFLIHDCRFCLQVHSINRPLAPSRLRKYLSPSSPTCTNSLSHPTTSDFNQLLHPPQLHSIKTTLQTSSIYSSQWPAPSRPLARAPVAVSAL